MRFDCCKQNFRFINVEKTEIEKEIEYELPEYRSNIQKILASDAEIKINEKDLRDEHIYLSGEIIWKILYIASPENRIKSMTFFENFEKQVSVNNDSFDKNDETKIISRIHPISNTVKLSGQRKIYARTKFLVVCDVIQYDTGPCSYEKDDIDPEIQIRKKEIDCAELNITEKESIDISAEISIDSDMPEIREIISASHSICLKSVMHNENRMTLKGELYVSFLYEAESEKDADYITYEKVIPFEREMYVDVPEGAYILPEFELKKFIVSTDTDDYSEKRIIRLSSDIDVSMFFITNKKCCVITDIYSTTKPIIAEKSREIIYDYVGTYEIYTEYQDRLKADLRGITDIIYSTADLTVSNPDFDSETACVSVKGVLHLIGVKESGDLEGIAASVNYKIPVTKINSGMSGKNIFWTNRVSVASYECKIINGEIVLTVTLCGNLVAFNQISEEIVSGYTESEEKALPRYDGFTLYYPEQGETVWDVAKNHMVNIDRFIMENNIVGEIFDGKTAVILH